MLIPARQTVEARVSRVFPYSAERVFDAWLDPRRAGRWLFATSAGEMVRVDIDPRVGGRFIFTDRRDGEDVEHTGQYLEIERPRRLVFDFTVSGISASPDRVTIDITPLPGGCELHLTHEMAADYAEYQGRTEQGWTMILESLARTLQ